MMRQDKLKLDYFYLFAEVKDSGEIDTSLIKIGHAWDAIAHARDYITGNHRQLICVLAMPGGLELESEFKFRFPEYHIKRGGGTEWYRNSPEILEFLFAKQKEFLTKDAIMVFAKASLGGPISIPRVGVAAVESKPVSPVSSLGTIHRHTVAEAEQPKDSRQNVSRKK